jgi:hypothetical protein
MGYERPSYKWYIEYNEGLGYKRENININEKSDTVTILKPKNDAENKSLTDKLLIDIKCPTGYIFSIAGRSQIQDIEEFRELFTLSIKVCDNNKNELSSESRIIINKEKEIDKYETRVVRLDSTFYKNVSMTEFRKEGIKLPSPTKTIDKLYKLDYGVEFKKDEHLKVYIVDPDIDTSPENVEFNINLDKWTLN